MKKTILFIAFLFLWIVAATAAIPTGYYDAAVGKKQAELKTALFSIIKNATPPSYGSGSTSTWSAFPKTDVRPDDGTVWDMYSNNHVAFNGTSAASGMNIEHSLANSWWGGTKGQTYNDLFNLNPSNSTANSSKGSYPMAVVDGTTSYSNGVIKVGKSSSRPGGEITAWEPADEYKGDFARSYMYMVTAYEDFSTKWTGNSVNQLDNNTYPVFEQWAVDLLLKWCEQDPISQKEITRNEEVYKIQGNRNPYIDYPMMAQYVWGKLKDVPFTPDGNVTIPYISAPSGGANIDFGKVIFKHPAVQNIALKAQNLTGDLTLTITGTDAGLFTLAGTTISKTDAENGITINVNYAAATIGTHSAQLSISGGGVSTTTVNLKASCADEFAALTATAISNNGFKANWSESANATGYTLNVYSLRTSGSTQPKTLLEEDFATSNGTWTKEGYTDNSLASNVRLASSGTAGKIISPALDLSAGGTLTVRAKQYSNDAGAQLTATIDNQSLAVWTTATANQDFKITLPAATATSKIALSAATTGRVYVDYVKIETLGAVQTPVSLDGYPKSIGNILTYQVDGLMADSTYFYTVQPEGNSGAVSNSITVRTLISTGIETTVFSNSSYTCSDREVTLRSLPSQCVVSLTDISGRMIRKVLVNNETIQLQVPSKGWYLLHLLVAGQSKVIKLHL